MKSSKALLKRYPSLETTLENKASNGGCDEKKYSSLLLIKSGLLRSGSSPNKLNSVRVPPWAVYHNAAVDVSGISLSGIGIRLAWASNWFGTPDAKCQKMLLNKHYTQLKSTVYMTASHLEWSGDSKLGRICELHCMRHCKWWMRHRIL